MADQQARPRRKNAPGAGRPAGPAMPCGWGCGQLMRAGQVRGHFRDCPKRPGRPTVEGLSVPLVDGPGSSANASVQNPSSSELTDHQRQDGSERPVGKAPSPEALVVAAGPPREAPAPVAATRVPVPVPPVGDPLAAAEEAEVRKALEPYRASAVAAAVAGGLPRAGSAMHASTDRRGSPVTAYRNRPCRSSRQLDQHLCSDVLPGGLPGAWGIAAQADGGRTPDPKSEGHTKKLEVSGVRFGRRKPDPDGRVGGHN